MAQSPLTTTGRWQVICWMWPTYTVLLGTNLGEYRHVYTVSHRSAGLSDDGRSSCFRNVNSNDNGQGLNYNFNYLKDLFKFLYCADFIMRSFCMTVLSIYPPIFLVCLSVYLPCLFVCLSTSSLCLPNCHICLSAYLPCLSVCIRLVYPSVFLSRRLIFLSV